MNYGIVSWALGRVLWVEASLMIFPVIVSLIYGEGAATTSAFLMTMLFLFFFGTLLGRKKPEIIKLYTKEGLVITGLSWVFLSVFGALPFWISREIPSIVDAFFETASGFTTTGASILVDVEALSHSMLFWRSFTHLIGGMGILVFTMAILPRMGDDTVHIMKAEVPGPVFGKIVSKTGSTARILYIVYLIMWALTVLFLLLGGMPLFDSIVHGFGAAGTGGFGIRNGSLLPYNSAYSEMVLGVAMILFGVNFNLYFFMIAGNWKLTFKNEELRWYLGIITAAIIYISFSLRGFYDTLGERLRHVFFTVSSIITTTGFTTEDYGQWPIQTHIILLILMFIGAMAGSTGGGIKISRVAILLRNSMAEIRRVREPKRTLVVRYENRALPKGITESVLKYLAVYVFLFWFLVIAISPDVPDFVSSFSAVAATINNIGPGLSMVGPTSSYADFSNLSKILLSFSMLAGRLELYPILLLFMKHTWKKY